MGIFGPEKMTLTLEKNDYKPGEIIRGSVTLKLKKPTMAKKLEVTFIGERREARTERVHDSRGHSHTRTTHVYVPIHDFKIQLDGEKEYFEGVFSFEIKIPEELVKFIPMPTEPGHDYKEYLKNTGVNPDGKAGKTLVYLETHKTLPAILGKTPPPVRWHVNAHLDIPLRFDVKESQQIILFQ